MADAIEIDNENAVRPKRRFDKRDFDYIAEFVIEEFERRKNKRLDLDKHIKEIDRQVAMIPDITHKMASNGKLDPDRAWMAEMELPYQAQALEVLTADARRLYEAENWFVGHAAMTDEYLREVDFQSLVLGDETEVPSQINQDNADKLAQGFLLHLFRQNDFFGRLDRINAEAFKYGMGVGRARMETKNVFIDDARGVRKETQKIPVLVPVSIKQLYLDDAKPSIHTAQALGPAHIAHDWIKLESLAIAANRGVNDPKDPDGGWMADGIKGLTADENGYVQILEMEGDIVVPRKTTRSIVIPGAIVTVALGSAAKDGEKATRGCVRFRFRKGQYNSYSLFPYHYEDATGTYPTSPLMKGRTVQIMAVQSLNRLMDAAALKNAPPVGWDRSDQYFASKGGPVIHPSAQWGTADPKSIEVFDKIGGDPAAMAQVLTLSINMYAELTGVLPARLGAQTVSHTTAFAKDAELTRGAVRTVDYVKQSGEGPVTRWLEQAYHMGRDALGSQETISFFIPSYGGFVEVNKKQLPETVIFQWFGAGGPAEEMQKRQMKQQSAMSAIQLDMMEVQKGGSPNIDVRAMQAELLRDGGWTDVDVIMRSDTANDQGPANPQAAQMTMQSLLEGPTQ